MLQIRNVAGTKFGPSALATAFLIAVAVAPARANVTWNWSSTDGTETGTFITDGNFVGPSLPAGTYTLSNFSVTSSALLNSYNGSSLTGGQFTNEPADGLIWNGSAPTEFFRNSGANTNGFNMYGTFPQGSYAAPRWVLDVNFLEIFDTGDDTPDSGNIGLTLTPSAPSTPEPASLTLLTLGGLTLLARCRRN